MKTRKSFVKRFKITKTGKVLRRATGQNHFRAKQTGKERRNKKRAFRALWQIHINAACRAQGLQYSRFIHMLKEKNIAIDRKILSELTKSQPDIFKKIVEEATSKSK